jgi:hypothetical protein
MLKTTCFTDLPARPIVLAACIVALAAAFLAARPQPASADKNGPPAYPANLTPPAGSKLFFQGHATGTQNYLCQPSGAGFAWAFLGPQATLFNRKNEQVSTHFLSPNPAEGGTARATWQHSKDSSAVWAAAVQSSTDPAYIAPGAIPWLLLAAAGAQDGPTGGDKLSPTSYIQRLNTTGGAAPASGCSQAADVGKRAFVPYTADYYFYR